MVVFVDREAHAEDIYCVKVDRALFNAAKFHKTDPAGDFPSFNARYLGDFAKVIDAASGNSDHRPISVGVNDLGPALVTTSDPDWFGVILPCRGSAPGHVPFSLDTGAEAGR